MTNSSYRWLIQQSKPASRWLFLSVILGITSALLMIIQASILATLIDRIYLHHATRFIVMPFLWVFLLIIFFRSGLTWLREIVSFKTAKIIKDYVRQTVCTHLSMYSTTQFSHLKTGALTSVLVEQVEALHGFFADYLPQMTLAVLLPLIILFFVFTQNTISGLILLITAPLIPLFMALIGINTARLNQDNFKTLSRMSAHFLDMLQGLTTLTLFNRAEAQLNSIATISDEYRKKTMGILRIAFLSTAALELFATVSVAMIAVYLGLGLLGLVHFGFGGVVITLSSALFILLLAPEFFLPLRQLGTFYHARAEAMGAADAIINILNTPVSVPRAITKSHTMIKPPIHLLLKNICFEYHNHKKIIQYFNCDIAFGECIAIAGKSGSGKTTLLNLIAKFIVPHAGNIYVNTVDLNEINDDTWREHIALLHQHPRLFHGTLLDNITISKPQATQAEIDIAINETGMLDFTQHLSDGLYTKVGEQNLGLSGGQVQRVALARIVLKNTPIVLLDEPTAHLDQFNIDIIIRLLEKWRGNKTVIMATHDARLMQCADRVIDV